MKQSEFFCHPGDVIEMSFRENRNQKNMCVHGGATLGMNVAVLFTEVNASNRLVALWFNLHPAMPGDYTPSVVRWCDERKAWVYVYHDRESVTRYRVFLRLIDGGDIIEKLAG